METLASVDVFYVNRVKNAKFYINHKIKQTTEAPILDIYATISEDT
jgi:hypothetical protein